MSMDLTPQNLETVETELKSKMVLESVKTSKSLDCTWMQGLSTFHVKTRSKTLPNHFRKSLTIRLWYRRLIEYLEVFSLTVDDVFPKCSPLPSTVSFKDLIETMEVRMIQYTFNRHTEIVLGLIAGKTAVQVIYLDLVDLYRMNDHQMMRTRIRTSIFKQIQKYFKQDYNYRTIIQLVEKKFNVLLSLRSLERILQYHKMKRKNIQESQIEDIVVAILLELNGGGYNLGYKAMWKRIRRVYGVEVKQKTVLELLHLIDPEGIDLRSRYRLKRRVYQVPGPNFLWHADGHDKLKRYGFAIYGIIDGYSRKVLLLEVSRSNNNPRIIGHYYLKLVQKRGYLPTVIRTDHGTEVILMEDFQVALRLNHLDRNAGEHSFVKGKSVHNQRIEAWWRQLRQKMCDFYIHLFRGMEQAQILDVDDPLHIETLRFCFGHLIRNEIENTRKEWNEHRIRKQNNRDVVAGQPNELFHCPENHGSQDCRKDLDCDNLPYLMDRFTEEPRLYSAEMERLVEDIPGVSIPSDAESAFLLYNYLIDFFNTL